MKTLTASTVSLLLLASACGDDPVEGGNEEEVITTVALAFTPAGGGATLTVVFDDADGDGGAAPTITPDPLVLAAGVTYNAAVTFTNALEEPAEDITEEVFEEGEEHQVFFTGTAVNGPASTNPGAILVHTYADTDAGGTLPLGLANQFVAGAPGTGGLTLTLRHLPPVNEQVVKTPSLAADVAAGGFTAIAGDTDVSVNFNVAVQ